MLLFLHTMVYRGRCHLDTDILTDTSGRVGIEEELVPRPDQFFIIFR